MAYRDDTQAMTQPREPGSRRRKLAGYLKAANELRQTYVQGWGQAREGDDLGIPGADVVRNGDEEMIIFPSYALRHTKSKPRAAPGTIQQVSGTGRDVRDTAGAGDAEFWKAQWEEYEQDKAIVDVDVRGWLYTPHKGQMSRKHRLMVGLARQLVGIPAPSNRSSPGSSRPGSRSTSPISNHRKSASREDDKIVQQQAEEILRKGEAEAAVAGRGGFSELPSSGDSIYEANSRSSSPVNNPRSRDGPTFDQFLAPSRANTIDDFLSPTSTNTTDPDRMDPVQKRSSWPIPANMTQQEIVVANNHLMARLRPFMANPLANASISAFFYNDKVSRQRTVTTNSAGHFHLRASLDFVPTHVRVLASENLSATEPVHITPARGVSMISDIDDTIKHSAISSGAREIFRNAFIRDLGDLTIDGVKQWYGKLDEMGVKIHYVSNSPWQLYPILTSFFKMAGLPNGSFHLKQYSGMLQGIFEPVAERKKATLEKIFRDFPERKFILIGDSGEADLEVYTDTVLEYPDRVLGVFIRDVTTPQNKGFFDPSMGSLGDKSSKAHMRNMSTDSLVGAKRFNRPGDIRDDEEELRKAVAESLKDMEAEAARDRRSIFGEQGESVLPTKFPGPEKKDGRPQLPPRRPTDPPAPQASAIEDNLIDFSDEESTSPGSKPPPQHRSYSTMALGQKSGVLLRTQAPTPVQKRSTPPPPPKPAALRSTSHEWKVQGGGGGGDSTTRKASPPPPPKPRKPSTTVNTSVVAPSPLSQVIQNSPNSNEPPPPLPKRPAAVAALRKLSPTNAYFNIKRSPTYSPDESYTSTPRSMSTYTTKSMDDLKRPPPARRNNPSQYPGSQQQKRSSGTWNEAEYDVPMGKKEELWVRRWSKAQKIMEERGILLRTWRVGGDVVEVCTRLVEQELRECERRDRRDLENSKKDEGSGSGRGGKGGGNGRGNGNDSGRGGNGRGNDSRRGNGNDNTGGKGRRGNDKGNDDLIQF